MDDKELTPPVRAKLRDLFSSAILIQHPMGTYKASVICTNRDAKAICGVLARMGILPEGFNDRDHVIQVHRRTGTDIVFLLGHPEKLDEFKPDFGAVRTITSEDLDRNGAFFAELSGKKPHEVSADLKIKGYLMEKLDNLKVTLGAARMN